MGKKSIERREFRLNGRLTDEEDTALRALVRHAGVSEGHVVGKLVLDAYKKLCAKEAHKEKP